MRPDITTREQVAAVYRRRAKRYDITANLFYLIGLREQHYRRLAVRRLELGRGDTVIEIGCGTGLNFALLEDAIGPEGRLIGVDLTPEMLAQAEARVRRRGWRNVALVQAAAADYRFPAPVDGILSTFALTLEPDFDGVIARGAAALKPGRHWVVLDLKLPAGRLRRLAPLLVPLLRPFAVSLKLAERHPWEAMQRHLKATRMEDVYFGFCYIATGTA